MAQPALGSEDEFAFTYPISVGHPYDLVALRDMTLNRRVLVKKVADSNPVETLADSVAALVRYCTFLALLLIGLKNATDARGGEPPLVLRYERYSLPSVRIYGRVFSAEPEATLRIEFLFWATVASAVASSTKGVDVTELHRLLAIFNWFLGSHLSRPLLPKHRLLDPARARDNIVAAMALVVIESGKTLKQHDAVLLDLRRRRGDQSPELQHRVKRAYALHTVGVLRGGSQREWTVDAVRSIGRTELLLIDWIYRECGLGDPPEVVVNEMSSRSLGSLPTEPLSQLGATLLAPAREREGPFSFSELEQTRLLELRASDGFVIRVD